MGAKFNGGGATVFYDNGVQAAASGTTGTQRNEFTAAIKSVTSSVTVGAVFIYDTSADSDGGAWRKKTSHTSWAREASSATRSARSEFPAMCLIVADNVGSNTGTVSLYDLDDPAMPLWMVFNANSQSWSTDATFVSLTTMSSVFALNGKMFVGGDLGLAEIDFTTEQQTNHRSIGSGIARHKKSGQIADRNDTSGQFEATGTPIVNYDVNDVSATILEGAEIGELGLPIPTVAVATAGGLSVLHGGSGAVYDLKDSSGTRAFAEVAFRDNGDIFAWSTTNGTAQSWRFSSTFADVTAVDWKYEAGASYVGPQLLADTSQVIGVGGDSVFTGGDSGLTIIKENTGNPAEGMVSHHTAAYATGYMVGDIRGAWLANNKTDDKSVKGNTLTQVGTIGNSNKVATGAELIAYDSFSASNHLTRAYDADFDFGTGDFSVMVWAKLGTSGVGEAMVSRYAADSALNNLLLYKTDADTVRVLIAGAEAAITSGTYVGDIWHLFVATRRGSAVTIYVDGKVDGTGTNSGDLDNATGIIGVGVIPNTSPNTVLTNGSLSLLRISATAPTPQQIKEIYDAEKPLFAANAKCLLQSTSGGSPNVVNDLAFDKSTGLLTVAQYTNTSDAEGIQKFRGLEMVDQLDGKATVGWSAGYAMKLATSGGVTSAYHSGTPGGVLVDLPSVDVRAELLEGESKLPDDGKLHFEGVTADVGAATPTVIGHIPIAENESVNIICKVWGKKHSSPSSSYYLNGEIQQRYYRGYGDVVESSETAPYKLIDTGAATMDVDLEEYTASDSVGIKVTGMADSRIVWKASVEVQRISDKTYER